MDERCDPVQLTDDLIKELQKIIPYAVRGVLGYKSVMTHEDSHGRLYHGCDYIDEITQSMLLIMLEDKQQWFEKAAKRGKKSLMRLVVNASRNLTIDLLRKIKEVPISQLDTPDDDQGNDESDDYN